MTITERTDLIQILKTSETVLLEKLAAVSDDFFISKPNENTWSMAELVEHLIITDTSLLQGIIKKGERLYDEMPEIFPSNKLIKAVGNRKIKVKAPDHLIPQGRFTNKAMAIAAFRASREKVESFVSSTELPLEKIAFQHFALGLIDGKGWIIFMAGHCQRHCKQMEELVVDTEV